MKRPRPTQICNGRTPIAVAVLFLLLISLAEAWQPPINRAAPRSTCCLQSVQRNDGYSHDVIISSRRKLFQHAWTSAATLLLLKPTQSRALDDTATIASSTAPFSRHSNKFGYTFQPPPSLAEGNKPLKTHFDEVNFFGPNGYQVGITIDPVRIDSLAAFGTPAQVAAKVVLAEVNRDGVFNVKLLQDPVAGKQGDVEYCQLDYLSEGKRGNKQFVCKFMIYKSMLYALTAQCKQEEFDAVSKELLQAVDSFQVIM